jgi:hypothetical protein
MPLFKVFNFNELGELTANDASDYDSEDRRLESYLKYRNVD